jgi:hypothetical protein
VEIPEDGLWKLAKWARKRGSRKFSTPPLQKPNSSMEHDHRAKAQIFKDTFFPPPPEADLTDTNNYTYPDPFAPPPITSREVERAIRNMPPKKAPGRDGIPAHILQQILTQLNHHLVLLYKPCLDL